MASLNNAWSISSSALTADQIALTAIANNTANAATPGYTEESAVWQQAAPVGPLGDLVGGHVGDGVVVTSVASQRDRVLDRSIDLQTQAQAATGVRLGALEDVESIFSSATGTTSSDDGIGTGLSNFFGTLQQLETSPSDLSLRQSVLAAASTLSTSFNAASAGLTQQQQALNGEVVSIVGQANGLMQALATVGAQIQSDDPNQDAGILEDQRQQDLASLSQLLGVQQTTTERNGINLSTVDGDPLVEGNSATTLTTGSIGGVTHIFLGTTDITNAIVAGGGQAGGLLTVATQDIPSALSSLDTLAYQFGSAVNTVNEAGTDLNGNAGTALFKLPATSVGASRSIAVAITDPALIAAASSGAGTANSTNAAAMAALAASPTVAGSTPSAYYASFVSALGSTVTDADSANTAQQASLTQLTNQQTALSGVSLNTEATNLENMEQAYQAASKVFTIVSELIADAINLGTSETAT